jgi:hypothetical protein
MPTEENELQKKYDEVLHLRPYLRRRMNATIVHRILLDASKHIVRNIEVHGTTVSDEPITLTCSSGDTVSVRQMKNHIKANTMIKACWAL